MMKSIRFRLALSYAGIALLVTLSLGAVLLVRLRSYYSNQELEYLYSSAASISKMASSMMSDQYSTDVQQAQLRNLAFLSQTRVRILNPGQKIVVDSGPWQSLNVGIGVIQPVSVTITTAPEKITDSVIVLKADAIQTSDAAALTEKIGRFTVSSDSDDVVYFAAAPDFSAGYGVAVGAASNTSDARSDQTITVPILGSVGQLLGFVELSEGPAYGREIINSVASGLAVAGGIAILLAVVVGLLASRRFSAPLLSLTSATQCMSQGDLTVRVAETGRRDEFGVLGKSFNQMASRIEETIQTLRRFLADAAHELQTPLTALRTNLELAQSEEDALRRNDYIQRSIGQIDRLMNLNRNLLNLSRLESGGQPLFQSVDLREWLSPLAEIYAARAEQCGQVFHLDLPETLPVIRGNQNLLQTALENLLDNAIKFTPEGGQITLGAGKNEGQVEIWVEDTGIGIPAEDLEQIFNRFHRGRNAAGYPGSGLGLAIAHAVAQTHGGSIEAQNRSGGGARLTLRLPENS